MSKFNLDDQMKKAEEQWGGGSSNWFQFKEGANKLRVLTPMEVFPQHYKPSGYSGICLGKEHCPGCKEESGVSIKWLCWVLQDDELKLAKLPHKVAKQLQSLQTSEEYAFDEAPMPYDITINATNAGTKEVEYVVQPARQNTDVSEEVLKKLEKENTPEEVKNAIKEKKLRDLGLEEAPPADDTLEAKQKWFDEQTKDASPPEDNAF